MEGEIERVERKPLTAAQIKAQVQLIQEVMQAVMKEGHHYGVIPGTPKPTLYKPGAEKLLSTFHIGADPREEIADLSGPDEIRYRVGVKGFSQETGNLLGAGIGECSSNEEKYKWRKPVCDQEFNEIPEDRKRIVWKKGEKGPYQQKQIRTNPADVANTVLKMAKKRALVDMTLTITAASDIFDQDLEDIPEEVRQEQTNGEPPLKEPQKKQPPPATGGRNKIKTPINDVVTKESKDPKKPWVRYTLSCVDNDNNEILLGTFDKKAGELAAKEKGTGMVFEISFEKGQYGNTITAMIPIEAGPPPKEEETSHFNA